MEKPKNLSIRCVRFVGSIRFKTVFWLIASLFLQRVVAQKNVAFKVAYEEFRVELTTFWIYLEKEKCLYTVILRYTGIFGAFRFLWNQLVEAIHDTQILRIFKISEVRHREEWAFWGIGFSGSPQQLISASVKRISSTLFLDSVFNS